MENFSPANSQLRRRTKQARRQRGPVIGSGEFLNSFSLELLQQLESSPGVLITGFHRVDESALQGDHGTVDRQALIQSDAFAVADDLESDYRFFVISRAQGLGSNAHALLNFRHRVLKCLLKLRGGLLRRAPDLEFLVLCCPAP